MKLCEVSFHKETIEGIKTAPLIRDNIDSMEEDFCVIYRNVLSAEQPEEASEDDMIRIKTDLFVAFCYGVQNGCKVDSAFRRRYKLPKEFNPYENGENEKSKLII